MTPSSSAGSPDTTAVRARNSFPCGCEGCGGSRDEPIIHEGNPKHVTLGVLLDAGVFGVEPNGGFRVRCDANGSSVVGSMSRHSPVAKKRIKAYVSEELVRAATGNNKEDGDLRMSYLDDAEVVDGKVAVYLSPHSFVQLVSSTKSNPYSKIVVERAGQAFSLSGFRKQFIEDSGWCMTNKKVRSGWEPNHSVRTCEECKELTLRLAFTDQTGKPSTRRQTPSEQTAMSDMDMAAVEDSDVEMSQPVEGEDEVKSRDQPQTAENETSESDEDAEDDASLSVDENSGDDAEEGEIEEDEDEDVDVGWSDSESDSDDQPVQPGRSQARTRACKYRCSHCSHYVERIAGRKRSTLRAALRRHLKQRHNMSDSDAAEQAREIIPLLPITDRSTKAMQRREKMHKLKNERLTDDEADELKKWVFRHYSDYLIQRLAKRMGFSLTIEQVSELFGVSSVGWFNNIAEKLDRYEDSEGKRYYWYQWGKGLGCFELDHEIEICTGTWAPVKAIMDDTGDVTAAYKQLLQCVDLCEILHIDNLQPLSTTDHIKKTIAERQKRAGLCMDITFDKGGGPPRSPVHRRKKVGKQMAKKVAKKVEQEATTEEPDGGAALAEEETKLTSDDENQQTAAATLPTQTHTPVTVPRDGLDRTLGLWGTLAEQERQRREEQNRMDRQAHEERRLRDRQRQRHAMRVRQATFNWKWVLSGRPVLTGTQIASLESDREPVEGTVAEMA